MRVGLLLNILVPDSHWKQWWIYIQKFPASPSPLPPAPTTGPNSFVLTCILPTVPVSEVGALHNKGLRPPTRILNPSLGRSY